MSQVHLIIPTLLAQPRWLAKTLATLTNQDFELSQVKVWLVVNAAGQAQQQLINSWLAKLPQLNLSPIFLTTNLGFAGAVNRGATLAVADPECQQIVLLNDDALVEPGWLSALMAVAETQPTAMIASLIYRLTPAQAEQARIDPAQLPVDSIGFRYLLPGRAVPITDPTAAISDPPFGPDAAAALYPRQLWAQLQGLDEKFFAYLEDVDLAFRAQRAGFKCLAAPEAVVYHLKHQTSRHWPRFKARQDLINWWRLILKNYTRADWQKFWLAILFERGRNLSGWLKSWWGEKKVLP